jgi:D-aminopeptidase
MNNLMTDVTGVLVGNAEDAVVRTGVTVVLFATPAVCSVDVRGGGPGTRETDLLSPERTVEAVDAIVLSGGSAFGLEAAAGAHVTLADMGRGFAVGSVRIPIVPSAILFDLLNGGDKGWGTMPPYRALGVQATQAASTDFALGTAGAGYGATTAGLKGGLGSASAVTSFGARVGALVAVNAVGSVTMGERPYFWAAPFEQAQEFGGRGLPATVTPEMLAFRTKFNMPSAATTIAVVVTDAVLTKAQARQLAVMAQNGLARAIYPVHTPLDGDTVFAASTGQIPLPDPHAALSELGHVAATTLARAIARGVYEAATDERGATGVSAYRTKWGG